MIKIKEIFTYPGMILYYLFLLAGGTVLFWSEKGEGVVWLNQFGNDFLDLFFIFWTYLGDGVVFGLLIVFFFFRSYFFLLVTLLTVVIQTIFVQGLKLNASSHSRQVTMMQALAQSWSQNSYSFQPQFLDAAG